MKLFNVCIGIIVFLFVTGCGSLSPKEIHVETGHFRFENTIKYDGLDIQTAHLMCHNKRPTKWIGPQQYEAGEHELWVKASIAMLDTPEFTKNAFVNFKIDLEADKSYMLSSIRDGETIKLWIQDTETGANVSDVVTADLKRSLLPFSEYKLLKTRCESGTV